MKCHKCQEEFPDHLLEESHDVPCYLFEGNRKGRKNQADKFGRHWMCHKCHRRYELTLINIFKEEAVRFAKKYLESSNG